MYNYIYFTDCSLCNLYSSRSLLLTNSPPRQFVGSDQSKLPAQYCSSCRSVRACVRTCVCTCPLLTAHVPPPPAHYVSKGHPATSTSSNPALMRVDSLVGLSLSCSLTLLLPRINPVQIILSKHHPTPTHTQPLPATWNSAVPSTRIKRLSLFVQNFTKQLRT